MGLTPLDWPLIHSYSRANALEDGTLVDVSTVAAEAGIKYPCAMTREAWETVVAWTAADNERKGALQDESGRLWDVLWMLRMAACRPTADPTRLLYSLCVVPRDGDSVVAHLQQLKAVCGPGDTPDPVITIMLPDQT